MSLVGWVVGGTFFVDMPDVSLTHLCCTLGFKNDREDGMSGVAWLHRENWRFPMRSVIVLAGCSVPLAWAVNLRHLNEVVERENRSLPAMVAKQLRQERVEVNGLLLTYRYTHLGLSAAQLREMHLEVTQRPHILPRICQEADTGRMLREGVSFRYIYLGNDREVGGQLQISSADCR